MSYRVETSKEVDKFLDKHKDIAPKILQSLRIIAQNPFDNALDIKKLQASRTNIACESANIACCMKSSMSKF